MFKTLFYGTVIILLITVNNSPDVDVVKWSHCLQNLKLIKQNLQQK